MVGNKTKILIIDDDSEIRFFLKEYLEVIGYETYEAVDGDDGLEKIENLSPDLVLCDMKMPGLDGLDLIKFVNKNFKNLPIITISGTGIIADVVNAIRYGAWDFLIKPFSNLDIIEIQIEKALDKSRLIKENKNYQMNLEKLVEKRTEELQKSNEEIQKINETLEQRVEERTVKLKTSLENLIKTKKKLVESEKMASIGSLAAGIAHEINNPLGFVMSNFRTLKNYMETINEHLKLTKEKTNDPDLKIKLEKSKKKIDFIIEDIGDLFKESSDGFDRIALIVDNMRRFSRVDSENEKTFFNLNNSIRNTLIIACNSYKYVAEVNLQLSDIPEINCNESEINQVLLNIIVNAAQAIEQQKRDEKGTINIRTYTEVDMVCCLIEDDGPGISQKYIKRVFDPFYTTKEVGKGTGMGLSISYDIIVNKHQGELIVESDKESGTVFIIKLHQNLDEIEEGE